MFTVEASPGTRVSQYYDLGLQQPSLEFIDVRLGRDTRLFVDPRAFLALPSSWGQECVELIQQFFDEVLESIRRDQHDRARMLLSGLHEPNEIRFGFSKERVAGRGVGRILADQLFESLARSEAIKSGMVESLEETALVVEGIGVDRVSDIATNIVRSKLAEFTVEVADKYGIPLEERMDVGPSWSPQQGWENKPLRVLAPYGRPLILVPRSVARWRMDFDPGEYYRKSVLSFLQDYELHGRKNSPLVEVVQSGRHKGDRVVYKKNVDKHYRKRQGGSKAVAVRATQQNPQILDQYRQSKANRVRPPETIERLHQWIGTPRPKWDELLKDVTGLNAGKANATKYHRAVEALLTPLFSPDLIDPKIEKEVTSGTQRIDIRYVNYASGGFFRWFVDHFEKAAFVPFECKNLRDDPANEEVQQIASRLNAQRGRLGFLVCRSINDRSRYLTRSRKELADNSRYILSLEDETLKALVNAKKAGDPDAFNKILRDLVEELID
jgi:hypothetical protein